MPVDPIAVIGMAARFPGSRDADEYWEQLAACADCITDLTLEDLESAGEAREAIADPRYVAARPLMPGADSFDANFFGMTPREAAMRDPQHRIMLELAHDALSNAGYDSTAYPGAIGVFAGAAANRYLDINIRSRPEVVATAGPLLLDVASNPDYLTTLTAFKLGLTGPAMTVATACSTSLVAVHQASQSLRAGDCDMALAGGVEIEMPYGAGYLYAEGGILSRDGRCRPFSADANGTNFGSGAGLVLLKRLEDARADGDHILGVIRGSAINNDGSDKVGFSAPSAVGQTRCVVEAMLTAGVRPAEVSYVEAHGTGTPLGDPIELSALVAAYTEIADGSLGTGALLSSVKSNIGHAGRAAGIAGLIKVLLAMRHRKIPGTAHFTTPNPHLRLSEGPFTITGETRPWTVPAGKPRIAGVSAFGIGGTNAHLVVEEPPVTETQPEEKGRPELVIWSAKTPEALESQRITLGKAMSADVGSAELRDIAGTLAVSRSGHPARAFVVADSTSSAATALLEGGKSGEQPARRVVWAFPGQGAQRVRMGLGLAQAVPEFRTLLTAVLADLGDVLHRDLMADLRGEGVDDLSRTDLAQPLLFAVESSLACCLRDLGVIPDVLIGHSVGEFVAALVAGVIDRDAAINAVAERALALRDTPPGVMLAVAGSPADVEPLIGDDVWISAHNSRSQVVLGGGAEPIAATAARLQEHGLKAHALRTSHAFHTPLVRPAVQRFRAALDDAELRPPRIPIISAATGLAMTDRQATAPAFWADQIAEPVLFAAASDTVMAQPSLVLELGPGDSLSALFRRVDGEERRSLACPTLSDRHGDEVSPFLAAIGALWRNGAEIDLNELWRARSWRRVPLPCYPFDRRRHWIDRHSPEPALPEPAPAPAPLPNHETRARQEEKANAPELRPKPSTSVPAWQIASIPTAEPAPPGVATVLLPAQEANTADVLLALQSMGWRARGLRLRPEQDTAVGMALDGLSQAPDLLVHALGMVAMDPESAAWSLVSTVQEIIRRGWSGGTRLVVLTRNAVDISGADAPVPSAAMLTGLVATIRLEHPDLDCRLVDVSGCRSTRLGSELAHGTTDVIALRGRHRWTRHWQQFDPLQEQVQPLRRRGTYLITGGTAGIGLLAAHTLAAQGLRPQLALLSRSGGAPAEDDLETLREMGASVLCLAADVAEPEALRAALERVHEEFGPLHGVLHSAGVPGGGLLARRTRQEMAAVLRPKTLGAENLLACLRTEHQLDFVLLYSSRAAWRGLVGSGDYAAANAYLDAVAGRADLDCPVLSVAWPSWAETGMAVNLRRTPAPPLPTLTGEDVLIWRLRLDPQDWLVDEHRVDGDRVVPGAGCVDLIVTALRALEITTPDQPVALRDVVLAARLEVHEPITVEVRVRPQGGSAAIELAAGPADRPEPRTLFVSGRHVEGSPPPPPVDAVALLALVQGSTDRDQRGSMVTFGPRWGEPAPVVRTTGTTVGLVELPAEYLNDLDEHSIHPALLDKALGLVQDEPSNNLPFAYDGVEIYRPLPAKFLVEVLNRRSRDSALLADVRLYDLLGEPLMTVQGFTLRARDRRPAPVFTQPTEMHRNLHADGLTNAEGCRMLLDLLASGISGVVAVAPTDEQIIEPIAPAPPKEPSAAPGLRPAEPPPPPTTVFGAATDPAAEPQPAPETGPAAEAGPGDRLAALWKRTLGITNIGLDQDFFDLGGDSLVAVQLMSETQQVFGVEVSVGTLFERPTLRLMTEKVAQG